MGCISTRIWLWGGGQLSSNYAYTSSVNSGTVLRAKLEVLEMKAYLTQSNLEMILDDVLKGEINIILADDQYSVKCPSYGLGNCTKKFYVAKVWLDKMLADSDNTSNLMYLHWSNNFKVLYKENNIKKVKIKI